MADVLQRHAGRLVPHEDGGGNDKSIWEDIMIFAKLAAVAAASVLSMDISSVCPPTRPEHSIDLSHDRL